MSGIILYKSKYGATKKYAEWIAERTGFACIKTDEADVKKLAEYDTIILGGGVYASGIAGLSFLKKNVDKLAGKKILVYCCGASPFERKKRPGLPHSPRFLKPMVRSAEAIFSRDASSFGHTRMSIMGLAARPLIEVEPM